MRTIQQTRRSILAAGVSGLAAGLAGAATRACAQAAVDAAGTAARPAPRLAGRNEDLPVGPLKVSIAGYSFRDLLDKPGKPGKMSLADLADLAAKWGIDAIEPTSYYFLKEDDEFVYALKRRIFLLGLEVSGMPVGNNFCLPPGAELDKQIADVRKWVDIGARLGVPAIRIFAGREQRGRSRDEVFKGLVSTIRTACDYAGARGIFLGIENHGYMTESAEDVVRIVEAVRHEWLGVNLDTGNFAGDAYAQIARLAPLAVTCQVKALARVARDRREPVDIPRVIGILREAKYRGYVTLEYEEEEPLRVVPELLGKIQAAIRS